MISKNHKTNKKVEKTKIPMVKPLLTNNCIYIINLLLKSGLTGGILLLMRKNCANLVCQKKLYLFSHATRLFFFLKLIFGVTIC